MDGLKLARIRCCHACRFRIQKHADFAGPHGYSIFCCFHGSEPPAELHDAYMEGPDENCPCGYWKDLVPVDLEAEQEQARIRAGESQVKRLGPIVEVLTEGLEMDAIIPRLQQLVTDRVLLPEAAADIALRLEGNRAATK